MPNPKKKGIFSFLRREQVSDWEEINIDQAEEINPSDAFVMGGSSTVSSLLSAGNRQARTRDEIYDKWSEMEGNPIVSTALQLQVTGALGGHETTGDLIFIEQAAAAIKDPRKAKICDAVIADLTGLFNSIAYEVAYTGAAFGDAYARLYTEDGVGIVDACVDELFRPSLVQPFQRGTRTIGFTIASGRRAFERLNVAQMARLKMPRTQWVPQNGVIQKSLRMAITEDDVNALPILPAMAGGSLLYNAEDAYNKLNVSLAGLVGQRWLDSIDEQIVTLQMDGMSKEQQERFGNSVYAMLAKSKEIAEAAVRTGTPFLERIKHILPVYREKQVQSISRMDGGSAGRNGTISIDDIMLHARMLTGSLGTDLSMVGFADQLSGGMGDGGFFRMSAQSAERARFIRSALTDFFNHIVNIHTFKKFGVVFLPGERPWSINFYGSISALESERQKTKLDTMNSGLMILGALMQMRELELDEKAIVQFLTKQMAVDEENAKIYAASMTTGIGGEGNDGPLQ